MKHLLSALKKGMSRFFRTADMTLFILCVAASLCGLLLIASAARELPGGALRYLAMQGAALMIGVAAFMLFSFVDIEHISALWKWIAAFNLLAILALIPFGVERGGNRAWIQWRFISIQPAEIVKLTFILLLACHMYALRDVLNRPLPMLSLAAHAFGYAVLVMVISNDMGSALVFLVIFIVMLIVAGARLWWFLIAGGAGAALWPLFWNVVLRADQRARILIVYNPESDPLGKGWNLLQSMRAIAGGGLFGQGLFKGTLTQGSFGTLPAKWTDFIFAVCAEELGLIGCLLIVGLLTAIIVRCLYVCTRAKSPLSMLFCAGVVGWLFFQTFENIGMCLGLTPVIGLTLPFISYGGTSTMALFAAMGMVSGVYMRPVPGWLKT